MLIRLVPKMHSSFMKDVIAILNTHSNIRVGTK